MTEVKSGALDEGKSNRIFVGTICASSSIPKFSGDELLISIKNLKFRTESKRKNDNIKVLL